MPLLHVVVLIMLTDSLCVLHCFEVSLFVIYVIKAVSTASLCGHV